VTISNTLSSIAYSGVPVAIDGTLLARAFSNGTAQITCLPFIARVGAASSSCTPPPHTLPGLNQSQLYYVYYIDAAFAGGNITPIATQNPADFENKIGYFLIGSIVTPSYSPRYQPSSYSDIGNQATVQPAAAYDNDINTAAQVGAGWLTWNSTNDPPPLNWLSYGDCIWEGFPSVAPAAATTLHCILSAYDNSNGAAWTATVKVSIAGTVTTLATFTAAAAETDHTMTIPAHTDLGTVTVEANVSIDQGPAPSLANSSASGNVSLGGFEMYIQ
jgi:hypothetical protein